MDRKEVNSCNFTFKNLYKPCARRYEIVIRLVDHFKKNKERMRTIIIGKRHQEEVVSRNFRLRTNDVTNRDPYRESDKHGPFKRDVSITYI